MIVKLPLANDTCPVDLRGIRVRPIEAAAPRAADDPAAMVSAALDRPLEGPPLGRVCGPGDSVTVVVPDGTRQAQLPVVLPVILDRLAGCEVAARDVTILVACGTHPPADSSDLDALLGDVPADVRVAQHDARNEADLVLVGDLGGLPIRLNRLVVECRTLITVSVVKHHYFAGFGGGPKMVFPGVAGYEEIQANHQRVLAIGSASPRPHPACEPGVLDGNPVAEEIARAADLHPPALSLCMVEGRHGGLAAAEAGPWRTAFGSAVETVRRWYEVPGPSTYDLAVASGGGAPFDATLIQAHKGLDAACRFLADGGELLYVADLSEGSGSPEMEPFLERPEPAEILRRLERGWIQYGHTTLRMVDKTSRFRVHLVSRLDPELPRRLGFCPVDDPSEVIESWRRTRSGQTAAVLSGPAVYPARS